MEDTWVWHHEVKWIFTVKLAYRLARKFERINIAEGSHRDGRDQDFNWNYIWSAPCPAKIKQFLWRFAHNSLPLRMSIRRRGVDCETCCPVCRRLNEDGGHLFLHCKFVRNVWRTPDMEPEHALLTRCNGPKAMLEHIFSRPTKQKILCIAMLWTRWNVRNKINAGEGVYNLDDVCFRIWRSAIEYEKFFLKQEKLAQPPPTSCSLPDETCLNINIDGSFDAGTRSGGWGFIIRDHQGGCCWFQSWED